MASAFDEPSKEKKVIIVKVTIVGDSQIGKTTLMVKYIEDKFDEEFIETLGLNVMEKSFEFNNCIAPLKIYDLGGQRQFAELLPTALDESKAVIFAFNLVNKQSLVSVKRWYKDARKLNKVFKPVLVGTKYDLFEQKEIPYKLEIAKMARTYAENMHSPLIFCSSKTSIHVKQVFTILVGSVLQIRVKSKSKHDEESEALLEYDVMYADKNKHKKKKKKKDKKKKNKSKKKQKGGKDGSGSEDSYYSDSDSDDEAKED
jgi:GTP-binding protein of the ras superfamily involved in termination of M-phase